MVHLYKAWEICSKTYPHGKKIVYDFRKSMKASENILLMMPCEVIGRISLPFVGLTKTFRIKLGINEY
jgi:hypothetical protein